MSKTSTFVAAAFLLSLTAGIILGMYSLLLLVIPDPNQQLNVGLGAMSVGVGIISVAMIASVTGVMEEL